MDTGGKLNVYEKFRRRPGRLLNALCAFHLRLVPTGLYLSLNKRDYSSQFGVLVVEDLIFCERRNIQIFIIFKLFRILQLRKQLQLMKAYKKPLLLSK